MNRPDFAVIEQRIRSHQGEQFKTLTGLPMTYSIEGDQIKVSRVKARVLSLDGARQIWELGPDIALTVVDQRIVGRAYLYAILRDPRIAS